jgi:hypothetical protein
MGKASNPVRWVADPTGILGINKKSFLSWNKEKKKSPPKEPDYAGDIAMVEEDYNPNLPKKKYKATNESVSFLRNNSGNQL